MFSQNILYMCKRLKSQLYALVAVCENVLKTVGGSRWPEEPLCLAVVWSVHRVDVVLAVCPQITPQGMRPLT